MRKQNREMSKEAAWECFDQAMFATLACTSKGQPYQIPLSMARIQETIYFHCAKEGQKWDMLKENGRVCISAVCNAEVCEENFTMYYHSVTIIGKAAFVEDLEEKKAALQALCDKFCPKTKQRFEMYSESAIQNTGILRIEVSEITGKQNPPLSIEQSI